MAEVLPILGAISVLVGIFAGGIEIKKYFTKEKPQLKLEVERHSGAVYVRVTNVSQRACTVERAFIEYSSGVDVASATNLPKLLTEGQFVEPFFEFRLPTPAKPAPAGQPVRCSVKIAGAEKRVSADIPREIADIIAGKAFRPHSPIYFPGADDDD